MKNLEQKLISLKDNQIANRSRIPFSAKLTVLNSCAPGARAVSNDDPAKCQADEFMKQGQFDKAVNLYLQSLSSNPDNLETNLNLAKTYGYNNQHKEAIPYLEKYVRAKPDDIENITLLGESYKKTGNYSEAEKKFNQALAIEPHYDYAKRNLLDNKNLALNAVNPGLAQKQRYDAGINNLTDAVKISKNFLSKDYMSDMKDLSVCFDKTSKMGGRSNIAQYEHTKRKISVTDEYTYADPKLVASYLIHEFTHGKDNDPYTSVYEEQDAYRNQAKYWTENVNDVYDPEMDYVADLYKQSAAALDSRVAEIYKLRDPGIPATSYNHPPSIGTSASVAISAAADQPLKAYDIIV